MFQFGDKLRGSVLVGVGTQDMEYQEVRGFFQFRTNDPEEYIQDIVIKTEAGDLVYIDR